MNPPSDPWDWGVDEVVALFCQPSNFWASRPNSRLPDPTSFEEILRSNDINGSTLLTDIDADTLKSDCGISSIGQRAAIYWVISELRNKSPKYQTHNSIINFDQKPYTRPSPKPSVFNQLSRGSRYSTSDDLPSQLRFNTSALDIDLGIDYRKEETIIQDSTGSKKRRLHLNKSAQNNPILRVQVSHPVPETFITSSSPNAFKMVSLPSRASSSSILPGDKSSFGPTKLALEDTFFGKTDIGQTLNTDISLEPLPNQNPPTELFYCSNHQIPARQNAVNRRILHYFNKSKGEPVVWKGKPATVVRPYEREVALDPTTRTVMLFQPNGNDVLATRQPAYILESGQNDHSADEWAFLNHWHHNKDDMVFPPASQWEIDSDNSITFAKELNEPSIHGEASSSKLPRKVVTEIIEKFIENQIAEWQKKKLPIRQANARSVWNQGQPSLRKHLCHRSRKQITSLSLRLHKLTQSILAETWTKKIQVLKQCGGLEQTVFQIEDERWKISIWENEEEPPASNRAIRTKRRAAKIPDSDSDGIDLDSDSVEVDSTSDVDMDLDPREGHRPRHHSEEHQERVNSESPESVTISSDYFVLKKEKTLDASLKKPEASVPRSQLPAFAIPDNPKQPLIIDLTQASSDVEMLVDPPTYLKGYRKLSRKPERATDGQILAWTWEELEERGDLKRLVIKLLRTLPRKTYSNLRKWITKKGSKDLTQSISAGLISLAKKFDNSSMDDMDTRPDPLITSIRLFLCWHYKSRQYFSYQFDSGAMTKFDSKLDDTLPILARGIENEDIVKEDCLNFARFIRDIIDRSPLPAQESVADMSDSDILSEEVEQAENGGEDAEPLSKKRKKVVRESKISKRQRLEALEQSQLMDERERQNLQLTGTDLVINVGKEDDEEWININSKAGAKLQQHQLEGLRFLWRQIVRSKSGCLLSHTMGLGKSMQAITLLVTIAEAASSSDIAVRAQIPTELQKSRTLLLCTPCLIPNWVEEFKKWAPIRALGLLGKIIPIESGLPKQTRITHIDSWFRNGGILIISYQMLQAWTANKERKSRARPLAEEQHETIKTQLLEGPNIIIADEAHCLKNNRSSIGNIASRFRSKLRIALTGSPLSNNLSEYHAMINWISPGYLGEAVEFRARYEEPISMGHYKDASANERRRAIIKLKALERLVAPKVHRRDLTVLKGRLKPKVEFMIHMKLTDVQKEVYNAYIESLGDPSNYKGSLSTWLWGHLAVLGHLCVHPSALRKNISKWKAQISADKYMEAKNSVKDQNESEAKDDVGSPERFEEDADEESVISIDELSNREEMINRLEKLLEPVKDHDAAQSHKTAAFLEIVRNSRAAGDGVLVFSQMLGTLDCLEKILQSDASLASCYVRLDGNTNISYRQTLLKDFNAGKFSVFLISTRAGGLGLNIPGANRVIIFDFGFNPTWEEQAIGRAYRLGQEKPVFVYRFIIDGTFESKVYNVQVFKTQLAYSVVENKKTRSVAERTAAEYLGGVKYGKLGEISGYRGRDAVLDSILDKHDQQPFIYSIATKETLQVESDETLTAAEEKEVAELIDEEKLRNENPVKWRLQQAYSRATQNTPHPPHTPTHNGISRMSSAPPGASFTGASPNPRPEGQVTQPKKLINTINYNKMEPGLKRKLSRVLDKMESQKESHGSQPVKEWPSGTSSAAAPPGSFTGPNPPKEADGQLTQPKKPITWINYSTTGDFGNRLPAIIVSRRVSNGSPITNALLSGIPGNPDDNHVVSAGKVSTEEPAKSLVKSATRNSEPPLNGLNQRQNISRPMGRELSIGLLNTPAMENGSSEGKSSQTRSEPPETHKTSKNSNSESSGMSIMRDEKEK